MTTQFNTCIKQWLGFNLFVVAVSVYVLPCFFAKKKKKKKKKITGDQLLVERININF
jgi:hypothetical protein